jgi:hypothetical protein
MRDSNRPSRMTSRVKAWGTMLVRRSRFITSRTWFATAFLRLPPSVRLANCLGTPALSLAATEWQSESSDAGTRKLLRSGPVQISIYLTIPLPYSSEVSSDPSRSSFVVTSTFSFADLLLAFEIAAGARPSRPPRRVA